MVLKCSSQNKSNLYLSITDDDLYAEIYWCTQFTCSCLTVLLWIKLLSFQLCKAYLFYDELGMVGSGTGSSLTGMRWNVLWYWQFDYWGTGRRWFSVFRLELIIITVRFASKLQATCWIKHSEVLTSTPPPFVRKLILNKSPSFLFCFKSVFYIIHILLSRDAPLSLKVLVLLMFICLYLVSMWTHFSQQRHK